MVYICSYNEGGDEMNKERVTDIRRRLAVELNAMRKEGYIIPRMKKGDFKDLPENISRKELRKVLAERYNYITPSGIDIPGTDALYIQNATVNKLRGAQNGEEEKKAPQSV